ncbi:phosphoribosylanthranilate isomerase [Enterococcus sp. LJL120]
MQVKICGLQTPEAIDAAIVNGADFIGFVFAESKRRVTPEQAAELTKNLPATIKKVGVFVSPSLAELQEISQTAGLDVVQIHGQLPQELIEKRESFPLPIIRAFSVAAGKLPSGAYQEEYDYLLLDAPAKEFVGGNGAVFDWSAVQLADLPAKPLFVAGGLTVDNVQGAKKYFHPFAVDVSSGVETNGVKDVTKIQKFLQQAQAASQE